MKSKTIYLAARYSRREELCGYREQLRALGYKVNADWLNEMDPKKVAAIEGADDHMAGVYRREEAQMDYMQIIMADTLIAFTDSFDGPVAPSIARGDRHVEFGIALANHARVIVVGPRENIFHWLPVIEHCPTWGDCMARMTDEALNQSNAVTGHPSALNR